MLHCFGVNTMAAEATARKISIPREAEWRRAAPRDELLTSCANVSTNGTPGYNLARGGQLLMVPLLSLWTSASRLKATNYLICKEKK